MQTPHSELNISGSVSDVIGALQNILARSQVIIPVLETPYSRFPNTEHSTIELERQSVINIIAQRQQQLDTVLYELSGLEAVIDSVVSIIAERRQQSDVVLDEISYLEAVMDSIKNIHQQVVEKKEKIMQSMNLHKGLLSALWRLPTEVLSKIFNHCLPETIFSLSPLNLRVKAPVLLTRICQRWREVAVCTPDLWCRLYVEADDGGWKQAAFCYDLWLKRSRGRPLSLELGHNYSPKLRSLLQPHMRRIKFLRVSVDYFRGGRPQLFAIDLLALQELTICGMVNHDIPTIAQFISRLPSTMRSLKFINMMPVFSIEHLSSLGPVWAYLTDVQIAVCNPNAFLHLLQLCPNLSSLNVHIEYDRKEPMESFTHTKLQSLCIILHDSPLLTRPLSDLFNAVSLPNLRVLEVSRTSRGSSWPHEDMQALLARSKCPLETLTIGGRLMITDAQRAEYVSLIPSLEAVNYAHTYF
ncbi:hypothetical protein EV424DRAFT_1073783 [Suillus variegatus]|nr:hypothetical protein EV424DRAFT_1073783 [Suillus variegatus]